MKKAFTLLELVFVIVVIGILAAAIIPNTRSNLLQEAAIQLVSDIRYTQHLAMSDDKYGDNYVGTVNWYKKRWSIRFNKDAFSNQQEAYTIFADTSSTSTGVPNLSEIALNPLNNEIVLSGGISGTVALDIRLDTFSGTKKMNLGESYGITDIDSQGGCTSKNIAFDHLGRPIDGRLDGYTEAYDANDLIQSQCNIVLTSSEGTVTVAIEAETGYAHIL